YAQSVERNLQWFDGMQDWADFSSALNRLLRALQMQPDLHVVPYKHVVAKRLAQCLNPAVPTGIHKQALELYSYILGTLLADPVQRARDLPLYSYGLFPFLKHASMATKPLLLEIYERH
ncbi:hypothetical protein GQ42DRAFT_114769, partial [Ramicandelaber brevisporus]